MSYPQPIVSRQTSTAGSVVSVATDLNLRHPTPDLQSLKGAYRRNVKNLERSAEELSASGSDIGEGIRRMNALSRQNSIQSSHHGDISVVRPGATERVSSTRSGRAGAPRRSSGAMGGAARWGGYSANGFVTSPVGSVSGTWSQASVSRRTSASTRYSHLRQVSEPTQEGRPLDSPLRTTFAAEELQPQPEQSRDPSQSSFARHYDEIAGQIEESLQHVPPSPPKRATAMNCEYPYEYGVPERTVTPPDRPRSTDTYLEAQMAFKDFDGVHFSPDTDEFVEIDEYGNELRRVSARSYSGGLSLEAAALLQTPRARPPSHTDQEQREGMVYYPAPVPKMLNLPKRLSQIPAEAVQSKRRSQMLQELDPEARAAAPWLSQDNVILGEADAEGHYNRQSVSSEKALRDRQSMRMSANLSNLPPHVRAQMYFEHQPVRHDVELKRGSAVATLDSILEASARAPVNAFTDHPYSGDVRKSVYSAEHKPRKSAGSNSVTSSPKDEKKHRRDSSSIGGFFRRAMSGDENAIMLRTTEKRVSTMPDLDNYQGPNKLRKSRSRMSLGQELERPQDPARISLGATSEPGLPSRPITLAHNGAYDEDEAEQPRPPTAMTTGRIAEGEQIENDVRDEEEQEDIDGDEGDPVFVKPSTLLAELQIRKAQQKSRGKTAATAFPQGMHSTLLQLDAVEEIAKRKRKIQRIDLAWEDPHQRALRVDMDKEDENVPLGMLFPGKDGKNLRRVGDGKDFDRPFGLIEKRQLEEEEPLSNRRNRLRGVSPTRGKAPNLFQNAPLLPNEFAGGETEAEPENETLGQRLKRMKAKDAAGADDAPKEGEPESSGFAEEVLSQFAGFGVYDKDQSTKPEPPRPTPSPFLDPNETLGQRKARLQREREANGVPRDVSDGATRLPLTASGSLASLLTANPVGQRQAGKTHEPTQGTLLHANSTFDAMQKSQLLNANMNASSHQLDRPLMSEARTQNRLNPNSLLANEPDRRNGGFASGAYNNGMGGIQTQTFPAAPMGMNGANPYLASPTTVPYAGYGYGYGAAMGYYPQMQVAMPMQHAAFPQQSMNPMAYNALTGGAMAMPQTMGSNFVGNAYNPGMMGGTYASYAQSMGGAGVAMGMSDEQITSNQRAAIDRWRLGVTYQ